MSTHLTPSAALPGEWLTILDTIDARLHEALTVIDEVPVPTDDSAALKHRAELAELAMRLRHNEETAAHAQALADDADLALAVSEDVLRGRRATTESLRQRLAAWAGRAIG
jgi:hypothetical protein